MNMFSIGSQVYFPFLKNNSITNISNNDSLNTNSILKKIEDNNQSSNKIFIKNQHENYAEDPFNQTFQIETSTILKDRIINSKDSLPNQNTKEIIDFNEQKFMVHFITEENEKLFELQQQPSQRQRKSYSNENRYIRPSPLIISPKNSKKENIDNSLLRGTVTVKLVDTLGNEFQHPRGNILEGDTFKNLEIDGKARFSSLKIKETSGNLVKLMFSIYYTMDYTNWFNEIIYSQPFIVTSNSKNVSNEKPILMALKPTEGYSNQINEIWIKGKNFHQNMKVFFDNIEAEIKEIDENMIVCFSPIRNDLKTDTTVKVTVANILNYSLSFSPTELQFVYVVNLSTPKKRKEIMERNMNQDFYHNFSQILNP